MTVSFVPVHRSILLSHQVVQSADLIIKTKHQAIFLRKDVCAGEGLNFEPPRIDPLCLNSTNCVQDSTDFYIEFSPQRRIKYGPIR